jgi:hypothetical protein
MFSSTVLRYGLAPRTWVGVGWAVLIKRATSHISSHRKKYLYMKYLLLGCENRNFPKTVHFISYSSYLNYYISFYFYDQVNNFIMTLFTLWSYV